MSDDLFDEIKNLGIKDLRKLMKDYGINGVSKMSKKDILEMIQDNKSELEGAGLFDALKRMRNNIGKSINKSVKSVKKLFSIPKEWNNISKKNLEEYGNFPVVELQIYRTPLAKVMDTILTAFSFGKIDELKEKYGYDNFFHLSLIATVKTTLGEKNLIIEKNEAPTISTSYQTTELTEVLTLPPPPNNLTVKNMMLNTIKKVGNDRFFLYDAFSSNCQRFILDVLESNGLETPEAEEFIYQNVSELAKELPQKFKDFSRGITDATAWTAKMLGRGEYDGLNNNEKEITKILLGGGKLEDENKQLLEKVEKLTKLLGEKDKIIKEQEIELEQRPEVKGKSIFDYSISNIKKFLRTEDEILTNPDVWQYLDGQTGFDKYQNNMRDYQQKFIRDWAVSTQELVIMYYGVGAGKTLIAVNCAEQYLELNDNAYVYMLSPSSLVLNTIKEMYMWGIDPNRKNSQGENVYIFVSYQQLLRSDFKFKPNSLLILDEAHNLRNISSKEIKEKISARKWESTENYSIVGTKLAKKMIENEDNFLRSIFMTGTLMVNSTDDLDSIISLGYKKAPLHNYNDNEWTALYQGFTPEDIQNFKNYFKGLISFYRIPFNAPSFPSKKYHFIPILSKNPSESYNRIRSDIKEKKIQKLGDKYEPKETLKEPFFLWSRNYAIDEKYDWVINFLKNSRKQKTLIYSQFLDYKINPLIEKLEKNKINYDVISGKLSPIQKQDVVKRYNNDEIQVLIFTLSIKEGISFRETNNFIVLEPYWNYAIMEQIIARGIRLSSHKEGYKSTINIYFLVWLDYENNPNKKANKKILEWFEYAEEIMNNDIKTLEYPLVKTPVYAEPKNRFDKSVQPLIGFQMLPEILKENFQSRDIDLYNRMFNKQETINRFEIRLLALPRFEDVNDLENNEFIKFYNAQILDIEAKEKRQLTFTEQQKIKRELYKAFYKEQIEKNNKLFNRLTNDKNFRTNRNPDLDQYLSEGKSDIDDKTLNDYLNENLTLTTILQKAGIDKKIITDLQANFTPAQYVMKLLELIDIENDGRKNIKILEPTAGIGNFIQGLVNLNNKENFMIDSNEIFNLFYKIGKKTFEMLDNVFWYNMDFLTYRQKYNYDYIIGNPPFNLRTRAYIRGKTVKTSGKADTVLYDIDFVARCYDLLNKNGKVGMIISDRFTRDKSSRFKDFNNSLDVMRKKDKNSVMIIPIKDVNFETEDDVAETMETKYGMVFIILKKILDLNISTLVMSRIEDIDKNESKEIKKVIKESKNEEKKEKLKNLKPPEVKEIEEPKITEKQLEQAEEIEKRETEPINGSGITEDINKYNYQMQRDNMNMWRNQIKYLPF
jgi:superfamily II DNA or RNA helicase/predicted RNA methylase